MKKTCSKCRQVKDAAEFHRSKATKDGYFCQCRDCRNVYRKTRSIEIAAYNKVYADKRPEYTKQRRKQYYKENKVKEILKVKEYRKQNPQVYRSSNQRRKAKTKGVSSEKFYDVTIFDRDGWICGICGKRVDRCLSYPNPLSVSLDHVVPLCKGGKHIKNNVQCSHLKCNVSKNASVGGQLILEMF